MMFTHCPPKQLPELETHQIGTRRFYILPDGSKVPSVTTVLSESGKEWVHEWIKVVGEAEAEKISRLARNRGNRLHEACELYLSNKGFSQPMMPDVQEMFWGVKRVLDGYISNIQYMEQTLWSSSLQIAGRVDLIANFDDIPSVIDFKTSTKNKKDKDILSYYCQCAAYALMYEELIGEPIKQIVIIMSVSELNKPKVFVRKTKTYVKDLMEYIEKYYDTVI